MNFTLDQLIRSYARDGFVVFPMMDPATRLDLLAWLRSLPSPQTEVERRFLFLDHFVIPTGHHIVRQWRGSLDPLRRFVEHGGHLPFLHRLLGEEIRCCYDQFIIKLPNDQGFDWHQDNESWQMDPDTNVTIWIAIEDVTLDNGCLWVVPRSHRVGLLPKIAGRFAPELVDQAVPLELPAGFGIAFSGYTIHGSLSNPSNQSRPALLLQYCTAATRIQGRPINQGIENSQFVAELSPTIKRSVTS